MNRYEREFGETNYTLIFDTSDYYKKGMNRSSSTSWAEHAAWGAGSKWTEDCKTTVENATQAYKTLLGERYTVVENVGE